MSERALAPANGTALTRPNAMEMSRAIQGLVPQSLEEAVQIGAILSRSGFFKDSAQENQAVAKVLAGLELGFPPVVSLTGIYVVEGKISLSANLMASKVRSHPRYDFRVEWLPNARAATGCSITFLRDGEPIGESVFTQEDAQKAGLVNKPVWKNYLRNMCYARAMSNGCRWYCPDAFNGQPVYTPEELGATVDGETGEIIDQPTRAQWAAQPNANSVNVSNRVRPALETERSYAGATLHQPGGKPAADTDAWETPRQKPATITELRKEVLAFCSELGVAQDRFAYLNYFNSVLKSEDERPWMKFEEIGADDWGQIWDELEAGARKRRQVYALLPQLGIDPDSNGGADRRAYLGAILGCALETTQGLTPSAWERCAYVMVSRINYPDLAEGDVGRDTLAGGD